MLATHRLPARGNNAEPFGLLEAMQAGAGGFLGSLMGSSSLREFNVRMTFTSSYRLLSHL